MLLECITFIYLCVYTGEGGGTYGPGDHLGDFPLSTLGALGLQLTN